MSSNVLPISDIRKVYFPATPNYLITVFVFTANTVVNLFCRATSLPFHIRTPASSRKCVTFDWKPYEYGVESVGFSTGKLTPIHRKTNSQQTFVANVTPIKSEFVRLRLSRKKAVPDVKGLL